MQARPSMIFRALSAPRWRGGLPRRMTALPRYARRPKGPGTGAGFSLMEVMTTVGILALAATLAIPGMTAWRMSTAQSTTEEELAFVLTQARQLAIRENAQVCVEFADSRGQTKQADFTQWRVLLLGHGRTPQREILRGGPSYSGSDLMLLRNRLRYQYWPCFGSDGFLKSASNGTIRVEVSDRPARCLIINATGYLRHASARANGKCPVLR